MSKPRGSHHDRRTTATPKAAASPHRPERPTAIEEALATTLAWRRTPVRAVGPDGIAISVTDQAASEGHGASPGDAPAATAFVGEPVASSASWDTSRTFAYGGLTLQVSAPPSQQAVPASEVPVSVVDTVLRMLVESHFAVWYAWHVPTAYCVVPGLQELLDLPYKTVPLFTEEWFGLVHPDDLPRLVAENDAALQAVSSFRSEYRLRRADGEYVWVSDWAIVLAGPDGRAEWMAGGIRDVTAEKALEASRLESARLHEALFKRALMPAILIDAHGSIVDANDAAHRFFAVEESALLGCAADSVLPVDLMERIRLKTAAGGREATDGSTAEVQFRAAGGSKWLLATVLPFEAHDGPMAFLLGADLTDHKRVSDALAESETSLRNQAQALEERNVALKVLGDQRREDLDALRESVVDNVEQLVTPTLDLLSVALADRPERALVDAARLTIDEITQPLLAQPSGEHGQGRGLTRREHQVLQLVRTGKKTEEIASALCLSPTTVTFHRSNIRKKLGLHGSGRQLAPEVTVEGHGLRQND